MAVTKVVDIVRRVEVHLQDRSNIRWPRLELQDALNEAYTMIILMRPDAYSRTGNFVCVAGTRQILTQGNEPFPSALRLLDVVRNLSSDSRKAAIRQITVDALDAQRPTWHAETETVNIQHFIYDDRIPKEFFVYPPAKAGTMLEVVFTLVPGGHKLTEVQLDPDGDEASNDTIILDDVYLAPIIEWCLYRAYMKDAEYTQKPEGSEMALKRFRDHLVDKTSVDAAVVPTVSSNVT